MTGFSVVALAAAATVFAGAMYVGLEIELMVAVMAVAVAGLVVLRPDIGLYLAIVLIPLEGVGRVVPGFSALTYAKVALIMTFIGMIGSVLVGRVSIRGAKDAVLLYWVFAAAIVGTLLASSFSTGIFEAVALAGHILVVLLFGQLFTDQLALDRALLATILSSIPVIAVGVVEIVAGEPLLSSSAQQFYASASAGVFRVASTFYDANALGRYLAFALIATLGATSIDRFRPHRLPLALLAAAQAYLLLYSFSRGAILAAGVGVLLLIAWNRDARSRIVQGLLALVFFVAALLLAAPLVDVLLERVLGTTGFAAAAGTRLDAYGAGLLAFERSPIVGYGPDGVVGAMESIVGYPLSPHNLIIESLLAVGIVGVALLAIYALRLVRRVLELKGTELDPYARLTSVAFAVLLLSGLTLHGIGANEVWIALGLMVTLTSLEVPA